MKPIININNSHIRDIQGNVTVTQHETHIHYHIIVNNGTLQAPNEVAKIERKSLITRIIQGIGKAWLWLTN